MSVSPEAKRAAEFQSSILTIINDRLQVLLKRDINSALFLEAYQIIFGAVSEVMQTANAGVSNDFVNFVSQHIYDCISIGGDQRMDPNIFTQRARIEDLSTGEILLAIPLMLSDVAAADLIRAVKGR